MNIENNTSIIDESSIYDYTKQYLQNNGLLNTEKEDTYRTSLILERTLMEKIRIMAFKEGSTITELISQMMRDYIEKYEKKHGFLERQHSFR